MTPEEPTHTPRHTIRIPSDVWSAASVKARASGTNVSEVVRKALEQYLKEK